MWFGVLGPVEVREDDGSEIRLDGPRQSKALAALVLEANAFVPRERLAAAMWDGDRPSTAVRQVQDAISGLRLGLEARAGGRKLIERREQSYRIRLDSSQSDLLSFDERLRRAEQAAEPARRAEALRAALALWRGPALAGLTGDALTLVATRLDALRYSTQIRALESDLELGRPEAVLDEIHVLALEHPFDENLAGIRMLALYRCGRRAEALGAFQDLRRVLADEFGVEPGADTQQLYRRMLNDDDGLGDAIAPPPVSSTTVEAPRGPRLLPGDTRLFTGRQEEIKRLIATADEASDAGGGPAGAIVISAIDGMAGVGKTALAVHVAHRVSGNFPDGQLFVDLRGYDPQAEPVTALEALGLLLRALGLPPNGIPHGQQERSALLRDRLAGTRTLLVLDNAASAAQVQPLLPGIAGCLVIVTSRRRLTGLDDAVPVELGELPLEEAVALLRAVAGEGRIPAEGHAVELVELCGRIPLAIRITAARLKYRSAMSVDVLLEQLRDDHLRLSTLADDERSLTAAFEGSYRRLEPDRQHLFRLLSLIPGQDFDAYAAANLLQTDHRSAERLLDSLLGHNLLIQQAAGRYRFHDLVRDYARSLSAGSEEQAALEHLLDFYEHTTLALSDKPTYNVASDRLSGTPAPLVAPAPVARDERIAWLRTERENVIAAAEHASAHGQELRAVHLTEAMAFILHVEGPWTTGVRLFRSAAAIAHKRGDQLMEADLLARMGALSDLQGDFAGAAAARLQALELYAAVGERRCQTAQLRLLCKTYVDLGDYSTAQVYGTRSLHMARELEDRAAEGVALEILGLVAAATEPCAGFGYLSEALGIARLSDNPASEASALVTLASVGLNLGRVREAVGYFEEAIGAARNTGRRYGEAVALRSLGQSWLVLGEPHRARECCEQSLGIFSEIGSEYGVAQARLSVALVDQSVGRHPQAIENLESALAEFRGSGRVESIGETLVALSRSRRCSGQVVDAEVLCGEAVTLYERAGHRYGLAWALVEAGELAAQTGDVDTALARYEQACELAQALGVLPCAAAALDNKAQCLKIRGHADSAADALREAVGIYRAIDTSVTPEAEARLAAWEKEAAQQ